MREIKFRNWDDKNKVMVTEENILKLEEKYNYIYNELYTSLFHFSILPPNGDFVMQYAGLKDRNGKEIYEGDIVGFPYIAPYGDIDYTSIDSKQNIEFKYGTFGYSTTTSFVPLKNRVQTEDGNYIPNSGCVKIYGIFLGVVMGNIYENPELLSNNK